MVSLSTDTAIIILATIAAVYFAITAVLLICLCCCICSKKKCKARVKPVRDIYSPPHRAKVIARVKNDNVHLYSDSTSFTSSSGASVRTESSSDVSGGLVIKNRAVVKRIKKNQDPYSEWQGARDSAILEGCGHVLSTNLSDEGTSSSGSTNESREKIDVSLTSDDAQTQFNDSKKDLSAIYQGDIGMDQSVNRSSQGDASQTGGEGDDDNVFEESATTVTKANEVEQSETADRPSLEERKRKKREQKKRKKQMVRTDSTKPLLNGSESRTQSETSDFGYELQPYHEPRPLTPMQEDQPSQLPSLTPLKQLTPRQTLTPLNSIPHNHHTPSSIVRERPVLPKIGQGNTPIKVRGPNKTVTENNEEEEINVSVL